MQAENRRHLSDIFNYIVANDLRMPLLFKIKYIKSTKNTHTNEQKIYSNDVSTGIYFTHFT